MAKNGVIFVAHGEPFVFDQKAFEHFLEEMFEDYRKTGIRVPDRKVVPAMVKEYETHYEGIDYVSPHALISYRVVEKVKRQLPQYDVRIAFLEFVPPSVPEVLRSMIDDGIKKILISPMLTTMSTHIAEVEHVVKEQKPEEKGVKIIFAKPLFYRPEVVECLTRRILDAAGDMDKKQIGIALIGHGEPKEWAEKAPLGPASLALKQEEELKQKVKKRLIEVGFDPDKIGSGWMEYAEPRTSEVVRQVAAKLVKKIIVVPTTIPTDATHALYDIPHGAMTAEIPPEIRYFSQVPDIKCLGGWSTIYDDPPEIIQALVNIAKENLG